MKSRITKRDNFAYLTIALVVLLLLGAIAEQFLRSVLVDRLIESALVLTLATGVWSFRAKRSLFTGGIVLTVAVLLVSVGGYLLGFDSLTTLHVVLLLAFFSFTAWAAIRQVLFSGNIDGNAIVGAICVYLLLGMIWALLFMLAEKMAPGSFKGLDGASAGAGGTLMDLIYFSFVSLTTMGFGDITPALPIARYLAFMEGVVGQFYIAILVSSLVGVRISSWQQE